MNVLQNWLNKKNLLINKRKGADRIVIKHGLHVLTLSNEKDLMARNILLFLVRHELFGLGFILIIFLRFCNFHPRYSLKHNLIVKKIYRQNFALIAVFVKVALEITKRAQQCVLYRFTRFRVS